MDRVAAEAGLQQLRERLLPVCGVDRRHDVVLGVPDPQHLGEYAVELDTP